jgi:hypothetical protein
MPEAGFSENEILGAKNYLGVSYEKALAYLRGSSPTEEELEGARTLLEAQNNTRPFDKEITDEEIMRVIIARRRLDLRGATRLGKMLLDLRHIGL